MNGSTGEHVLIIIRVDGVIEEVAYHDDGRPYTRAEADVLVAEWSGVDDLGDETYQLVEVPGE